MIRRILRRIVKWVLNPLDNRIRRISDEVRVLTEQRGVKSQRVYR